MSGKSAKITASKSQTTQQTANIQRESLETEEVTKQEQNPLAAKISSLGNTPNPNAHTAMINRAAASPQSSQQVILQLQRQYGNRYVNQVLQQSRQQQIPIQAKLTLGAVGDQYEQEADRVAKQVVNQIQTSQSASTTQTASVQREMMPEEEELQRKPIDTIQREGVLDEENELGMNAVIQRSPTADAGTITPDLETSIQQARGSGQPLADNIRQPMEQAFGADFSGVKIHTDAKSNQLNQSIQAKAFTTGQDVFFRQGEYNPGSSAGQELLAHELTHVVQQGGNPVQDVSNKKSSKPQQAVHSQEKPKRLEVLSGRKIHRIHREESQIQRDWVTDVKRNTEEDIQLVEAAIQNYTGIQDKTRPKLLEEFKELADSKSPMLLESWVRLKFKLGLQDLKESRTNKWKKIDNRKRPLDTSENTSDKESVSKKVKQKEDDSMDTDVVNNEKKIGGESTDIPPVPQKPVVQWAVSIDYEVNGEEHIDWSKSEVPPGKVKSVNIPGDRPPGTSGEKEGGHLTAWVVMRSQVAQKVYPGIAVDKAIQGMFELIEHYQMLPGHGRAENYTKENLKTRYQTARQKLLKLLEWKDNVNDNRKREFLRTQIESYLQARNAMPLAAVATTENTGGGESAANERLWVFEQEEKTDEDALYPDKETYCAGLLWIMYDAAAAANWAEAEEGYNWESLSQPENEDETTPLDKDDDPSTWQSYDRRIIETIVQHIMSVEQAYPKAAKAVDLSGTKALGVLFDWFKKPEVVKKGVGIKISNAKIKWEDLNLPFEGNLDKIAKRVKAVREKADNGEYKPKDKLEISEK